MAMEWLYVANRTKMMAHLFTYEDNNNVKASTASHLFTPHCLGRYFWHFIRNTASNIRNFTKYTKKSRDKNAKNDKNAAKTDFADFQSPVVGFEG